MKKSLWVLLTFLAAFMLSVLVLPNRVLAQTAEQIEEFHSDIAVNKDGTIQVKETIKYDFGASEHHGIFRKIPTIMTNKEGKKFQLTVGIQSVTDEVGNRYQYDVSEGNTIQVKIGDPSALLTGKHTYVITYKVSGEITYFSDHDELYWNVTGNEWLVPMGKVTASVTLPTMPALGDSKLACYTGRIGSSEAACSFETVGKSFNYATQSRLGSGEGLTIVLGFPKNLVAVLEPTPYIEFSDTFAGKIFKIISFLLGFIWYIGLPVFMIANWFLRGRDPKVAGPVSAWYDPPKTKSGRFLTPGETGTLIDETVDLEDISASLINLAQRGYFKIVEKAKSDFYFVKEKDFDTATDLQDFEKILLQGIFGRETEVRVKDGNFASVVQLTNSALYKSVVNEGYFPENPQTVRTKYYIFAGIALFTGNFLLAIITFVFGRFMPRKTVTGAEAASVAQSLKNFLSTQERQLEFQAKNQMFFEKLLPFAIAFGVEKVWADRFKDISLQQPNWYQGYNNDVFTANVFANSLQSSLSSFRSAATPTTSSSGFSSGFSGGFSGGGGGGGGGGSW